MKLQIIDPFRPVQASATFQSFDAIKFMKRMKAKEKTGWWHRFLNSVDEKREEIRHDLRLYKAAK